MSTLSPAVQTPEMALAEAERDRLELIKRTVAKGATDDELRLFLYQAKRTGLDPLSGQIHFIKRWDAQAGREVGRVQTGIDGLRLIAKRTERYRPDTDAPRFTFDQTGTLISARVRVFIDVGGDWFPVETEAFLAEYIQTRKDGKVVHNWAKMPRLMLAKCAEALALRKTFPAELSGIYAIEELPGDGTAEADRPEGQQGGEATGASGGEAGHDAAAPSPSLSDNRKTAMQKLNAAIQVSGQSSKQINSLTEHLFGPEATVASLTSDQVERLADELQTLPKVPS